MCKTYNTIGSLTTLKSHLERNNIHDFKSLKEVLNFQNSYSTYRQQVISHHENLIEQEKNMLHLDLQQLDTTIVSQKLNSEKKLNGEIDKLKQQLSISTAYASINYFLKFTQCLRQWSYKMKIKNKERSFDFEVEKSIAELVAIHRGKSCRSQFIISQFDEAVQQSAQYSLSQLERKKTTIDELRSFIYGALGEQKVVKTLEALSDDFFLINDFTVSFSTAIYNRQENDYIKSIQIDHILVATSGIFIIETKNWSEKSIESLNLRSPVQQIKRTNFALFKLLNNEMSNHHLRLHKHHWGDKKVPIRNLIVLTNTKPKEEFLHVKVLTLHELLSYVNYFKPIFSTIETQGIADYLLDINNLKEIVTTRH